MDTTFVRAFTLLLALTGFGATTNPGATGLSGSPRVVSNGITGGPVALCDPHDPNHCGLD